jgi:hypothetical protein
MSAIPLRIAWSRSSAAPTMALWTANCDPVPPAEGGPVSFPDCYNLRGNSSLD